MKQAKRLHPKRKASIRAGSLVRRAMRLRPTKIIISEADQLDDLIDLMEALKGANRQGTNDETSN